MRTNHGQVRFVGSLLLGFGAAACTTSPGAESSTSGSVGVTRAPLGASPLFATGVDDTGAAITLDAGSGQTDLHYQLVQTTDPKVAGDAGDAGLPAYVAGPSAETSATWVPNSSSAHWISAFADTKADPLPNTYSYTYRTTFTLDPGVDPTKLVLSGGWACDDQCSLVLNGSTVLAVNGPTAGGAYRSVVHFTVPEGSITAPSTGSTYTLDFVVENPDGLETGLLVTELSLRSTLDDDDGGDAAADTSHADDAGDAGDGGEAGSSSDAGDGGTAADAGDARAATDAGDAGDAGLTGGDAGDAHATTDAGDAATASDAGDARAATDTGTVVTYDSGAPGSTGACAQDSDCQNSLWCDTATSTCVAKPANACRQDGDCESPLVCDLGTSTCVASPARGCVLDTECGASQWCDTSTGVCGAKMQNGAALAGICTPEVARSACLSGVCDKADNRCGYAMGNGPCTAADGLSTCRSGACIDYAHVCGIAFVPSGNGVACSLTEPGRSARGAKGASYGAGLLALAALLVARRRRGAPSSSS